MEATKRAKNAGAKVIVDADSYSSELMEHIDLIDAFVGSEFFYDVLFHDKNYEENCKKVCEMGPSIVVFTLGAKGCVGYSKEEGFFELPSFDVVYRGDVFTHVALRVPGEHNVKNALAAAAAAIALAVEPEAVSEGLAAFRGAGRRFEHKGTYHGAEVYDDYAHHPGELHALLSAARTLGYERVICAFQPHTYTRTHALFNDFVEALRAPDITLLAEIYAAREVNDIGISSKDLAARIPGSEYYATLPEVTERLRALARPGDLILTVGAGDIFTVGEALLREG